VHEPPQRIIDPRGVEQRQWTLGAGIDVEHPVGDLVAHHRERRRRKMAPDLGCGDAATSEFVAGLEHIGVSDFLSAQSDFHLGAELGRERLELLQEISSEILRMRHRRRIDAGRRKLGEGARARGRSAFGAVCHAQTRIAKHRAHLGRGRDAVVEEAIERPPQGVHRLTVA
jgi:hypothetical protein